MTDWVPSPGRSQFPALYKDRDTTLAAVNHIITTFFPTIKQEAHTVVAFSELDDDGVTVLNALRREPRATLDMLLAVSGLSKEDITHDLNIASIYTIEDTSSIHTDDRATAFAPYITDRLTTDLTKQTVLSETAAKFIRDQRRHYRGKFEEETLDFLADAGLPLRPDTEVAGQPDIAIPGDGNMAIVGEIKTGNKQDWGTRVRELRSQFEQHSKTHPEAKLILVCEFDEPVGDDRITDIKDEFKHRLGDLLDGFYTTDDFDRLRDECTMWAPQHQETISTYTTNKS
ncbi:hypothetical protein [Salinibaculum rarum]|uniref:hypothetical protein n=1 Tax=Salinibaculum rarum TaxID=3058903 RepID=UPI00265D8B76|nr:hypothetical protein [Salinibaculum sp. KK48]